MNAANLVGQILAPILRSCGGSAQVSDSEGKIAIEVSGPCTACPCWDTEFKSLSRLMCELGTKEELIHV